MILICFSHDNGSRFTFWMVDASNDDHGFLSTVNIVKRVGRSEGFQGRVGPQDLHTVQCFLTERIFPIKDWVRVACAHYVCHPGGEGVQRNNRALRRDIHVLWCVKVDRWASYTWNDKLCPWPWWRKGIRIMSCMFSYTTCSMDVTYRAPQWMRTRVRKQSLKRDVSWYKKKHNKGKRRKKEGKKSVWRGKYTRRVRHERRLKQIALPQTSHFFFSLSRSTWKCNPFFPFLSFWQVLCFLSPPPHNVEN